MGKLFRGLGKAAKAIGATALPVVIASIQPEALINTAIAGAAKHTPLLKNNNAIPYLNMAISSVFVYFKTAASTGDWVGSVVPALQAGGILTALSMGIHQFTKLPLRAAIKNPAIAAMVGPGEKFSI